MKQNNIKTSIHFLLSFFVSHEDEMLVLWNPTEITVRFNGKKSFLIQKRRCQKLMPLLINQVLFFSVEMQTDPSFAEMKMILDYDKSSDTVVW